MTNSPQLRPLGDTLGTEALGIDLSQPLDETTFDWVSRAFAEHPVLVFRVSDQLRCGEISLFERDQTETEMAKARLEAKRAQRRERHARNKDGINVRRRARYALKKSTES